MTPDMFTLEILRNYFLSTVREMINTTVRAAYSTVFSEGLDFTCGLFDRDARLFAQAGGNPVHIGALDDELAIMLDRLDGVEEGDVLLHNDPYEGADHQSDVVVATPIFSTGVLIGFSVNRGHWTDIGASFAGGYGLASHVVQEGLIIPPCKLFRKHQLNREVRDFILRNVRSPRLVWGDLQAQIASARVASERVNELIARHGASTVLEAIQYCTKYTRDRFTRALEVVPDGTYTGEDALDDDGFGGGPYRITVRLTKTDGKITADFEGSDSQAPGPANCTLGGTKAAVYSALLAVIDPDIPVNSGIADVVEVIAPEGTVVNPVSPAPVGCAPADPSSRVCETVLRALGTVLPDRATAGSYSSGLNVPGWGVTADGDEFTWYMFGPGGTGARRNRDGVNVEWHTMVMSGHESVEVWERRYPVRVVKRELRIDSGGAGRTRGGLGDVRVVECLNDTLVSGYIDRCTSSPWGIHDGGAGSSNDFALERDGLEQHLTELGNASRGKFANLLVRAGERMVVRSGGGGGYGPAAERSPEAVALDVKNGYVSRSAAETLYGVVLTAEDVVDEVATTRLRHASKVVGAAGNGVRAGVGIGS